MAAGWLTYVDMPLFSETLAGNLSWIEDFCFGDHTGLTGKCWYTLLKLCLLFLLALSLLFSFSLCQARTARGGILLAFYFLDRHPAALSLPSWSIGALFFWGEKYLQTQGTIYTCVWWHLLYFEHHWMQIYSLLTLFSRATILCSSSSRLLFVTFFQGI